MVEDDRETRGGILIVHLFRNQTDARYVYHKLRSVKNFLKDPPEYQYSRAVFDITRNTIVVHGDTHVYVGMDYLDTMRGCQINQLVIEQAINPTKLLEAYSSVFLPALVHKEL
jgi:hypothetical protein